MIEALTIYVTGVVVFLWREWLLDQQPDFFVALTWPWAFIYLTLEELKKRTQAKKSRS